MRIKSKGVLGLSLLVVMLLGVFPVAANPSRPVDSAVSQQDSCLMAIEIYEFTPHADKGDAVYGLFKGDMEIQFHLAVTNGRRTWDTLYPGEEDWVEVDRHKPVITENFHLIINMADFSEDELFIYFLAVEIDPIEAFGYNMAPLIRRTGNSVLGGALRFIAPDDLDSLASLLVEYGVERFLIALSPEDIIGQGSLFLDAEGGWGTREILTYITPDKGLEVKYRVFLAGEACATDKTSV